MFIAKIVMYGVLGGVMAIFGIGAISNPIAWISIFGCVMVIDVLAMLSRK